MLVSGYRIKDFRYDGNSLVSHRVIPAIFKPESSVLIPGLKIAGAGSDSG
jgi:hypothetical protein